MTQGVMDIVFRFWVWWMSELAAIGRLVFKLRGSSKRTIKFSFENSGIAFNSSADSENVSLPKANREHVDSYLKSIQYSPKVDNIELCVDEGEVLISEVEYPIVAKNKLDQLLKVYIQESLPFKVEDVYSSSEIVEGQTDAHQFAVRHGFAKRPYIDGLIKRSDELGLLLAGVNINKFGVEFNFLPATYRSDVKRTARLKSIICFAFLAFSLVVFVVVFGKRQNIILDNLKDQSLELRAESFEVREISDKANILVNEMNSIREEKKNSPKVISIWNDVSRLLPRESEVTQFNYSQGEVKLSGFSSTAGTLISIFEGDRSFSEVSFSAPVTFDRRENKEKFVVTMQYNSPAKLDDSGSQNGVER